MNNEITFLSFTKGKLQRILVSLHTYGRDLNDQLRIQPLVVNEDGY